MAHVHFHLVTLFENYSQGTALKTESKTKHLRRKYF